MSQIWTKKLTFRQTLVIACKLLLQSCSELNIGRVTVKEQINFEVERLGGIFNDRIQIDISDFKWINRLIFVIKNVTCLSCDRLRVHVESEPARTLFAHILTRKRIHPVARLCLPTIFVRALNIPAPVANKVSRSWKWGPNYDRVDRISNQVRIFLLWHLSWTAARRRLNGQGTINYGYSEILVDRIDAILNLCSQNDVFLGEHRICVDNKALI